MNGEGVLTTSILNMPGFTAKVKVKDAKLLYQTAATTLAIEEGIPFRTFSQPSFHQLFIPLNAESDKIVNLSCNNVRDLVGPRGACSFPPLNERPAELILRLDLSRF